MNVKMLRVWLALAALTVGFVAPAEGQTTVSVPPGSTGELAMSGTAVSSSRNTLTVRIDNGPYVVFIFDRYTKKPQSIAPGAKVRVLSVPTGEAGVRVATDVFVTPGPVGNAPSATAQPDANAPPAQASAERSAEKPYESGEAVPVSVRKLEGDIERQSRHFGAGFRTGVGLDPEVFTLGVQARIGPFFDRNFSFRPNLDFGFGEVTKMFVLDLNGVYRLNPRQNRWAIFVGAGPALFFMHRNFEEAAAGKSIDFGEFKFQSGLNFLTGVEFRSGFFVEGKTTVWAGPHLRLAVGYSF